MQFFVLGTAGHIDHGKTALVRLLTGTDTDRLKEEKARGISIDLGFAHLDLPGGVSCGIVDVPGHERFVKNMLAGACGIDAMLFVVAADEGIMPQTKEHLDILQLLGIEAGVVALTKIDMVEPEWLELVEESVRETLEQRGLEGLPVVRVSSRTGEGREAVTAALSAVLRGVRSRSPVGAARMPVDRVFTIDGFGTVVTGTLWSGAVRAGDALVVEPAGSPARVRSVEVHGETAERAVAGQRSALALSGLERQAAPRGSWVLTPGSLAPSHMIDVRLRVLPDAAKEIGQRQRVRFHLGATEALGRVTLFEGDTLEPGRHGLAQLRLESPVVAARGDRFVLRSYSPARAVAGGTVLVPNPPKRKQRDPGVVSLLHREESGSDAERVLGAVAAHPAGTTVAATAAETGLEPAAVRTAAETLVQSGRVLSLGAERLVGADAVEALAATARSLLAEFHRTHPLRWGMSRGELKSRLGRSLAADLFERVLQGLESTGEVHLRRDLVRRGGPELEPTAAEAAWVERVRAALDAGGLSPQLLKELARTLGADPGEALECLTFQGLVEKVTPELYVSRHHLDRLRTWIEDRFRDRPQLAVGDLREAFGLSRKYSVPILELFDRQGLTRRHGDVRVAGKGT